MREAVTIVPEVGDCVQILDETHSPSENFVYVGEGAPRPLGVDTFEIIDEGGEAFVVSRNAAFDTDLRRAWVEVRRGA